MEKERIDKKISVVGRAVPKPAEPEPKVGLALRRESCAALGGAIALPRRICANMTDFRIYVSTAPNPQLVGSSLNTYLRKSATFTQGGTTRSCGAREFQAGPTVRQLLDCASPLALSHAQDVEPKAAEDCRTPRRFALSRPNRACARLVNGREFLRRPRIPGLAGRLPHRQIWLAPLCLRPFALVFGFFKECDHA